MCFVITDEIFRDSCKLIYRYFAVPSRIPNPYHVYTHNSYVPTSAQDSASEMQSLSSDALTEDTVSQADSAM